jgi:hypothetical protein
VLGSAIRDIRRHPLATLLLVGAVPSLWGGLVFQWWWGHVARSGWQLGPTSAQLAFSVSRHLVGSAWNSILVGGQYLVGLDIGRGAVPRASHLFRGTRSALRIFLTTSAISLAFAPGQLLVAYRRSLPTSAAVAGVLLWIPIALLIVVRSVASVPLVVDKGHSVFSALRSSWSLTAGNSLKITYLFLLFVPLVGPLALAYGTPVLEEAIQCLFQAIGTMTVSHLYLRLTRSNHESPTNLLANELEPGQIADGADVPIHGSGWTKEVNDPPR